MPHANRKAIFANIFAQRLMCQRFVLTQPSSFTFALQRRLRRTHGQTLWLRFWQICCRPFLAGRTRWCAFRCCKLRGFVVDVGWICTSNAIHVKGLTSIGLHWHRRLRYLQHGCLCAVDDVGDGRTHARQRAEEGQRKRKKWRCVINLHTIRPGLCYLV